MRELGVLLLIVLLAFFTFMSAYATITSSPIGQFNVTQDVTRLNWTNNFFANITITPANVSFTNLTVEILNREATSSLTENYTQGNTLTSCQSPNNLLNVTNASVSGVASFVFIPQATNSSDATLFFNNLGCKPGRYYVGTFTIRNITGVNDTVNITVFVDLPISTGNSISASTGIGTFGGTLPANATTYHSYYFSTSNITNATGVFINISGWSSSQDVDLFLFDGSTTPVLKEKSINKTSTNESLLFNYLPSTGQTWEIRIYGNSTSTIPYSGTIVFTTLNATNASNTAQQFGVVNFGILNTSSTSQVTMVLKNEGSITHSNVVESKELYHVRRFAGNGTQNFTFLVPSSSVTQKVKISLNWTGGSNYSFSLYDTTGTLKTNSTNKYVYANITKAPQEEYGETTSIGSTGGLWTVVVTNNTNITQYNTEPYNVTAFIYLNASTWLATNYTTVTFNRTGLTNSSFPFHINLTVQNASIDGLYEGSIQYLDSNRTGIKIPISFNVTTPVLLVNNSLSTSGTFRLDENIGSTLTRSMTIVLTNNGTYTLIVVITNSSLLTCSSCSTNTTNFTFNTFTSIPAQSSQTLVVNITFNSTNHTAGTYDGWIFVNGTNSPTSSSSHPYETFNITVRLNLSTTLDVPSFEVKSIDGDTTVNNVSVAENVTIRVIVNYINGTEIGTLNELNTNNFSVWLVSTNISSYRKPTSGGLSIYNGTNLMYGTFGTEPRSTYHINFTTPTDIAGGVYTVYVSANYTRNPTFTGTGSNSSLVVNNTGLFMSSNSSGCSFGTSTCSSSFSMSNATTTKVYANVTNYGFLTPASAAISFNESCVGYTVSSATYLNCPGNTSFAPSGNSSTCLVYWTITANSSYAHDACVGWIEGSPATIWYDKAGINFSITISAPSATTTTTTTTLSTGGGGGGGGGTTAVAPVYLNITSYSSTISIEQGKNKTEQVIVKNINNTVSQVVTLTIVDINSSWYSINPSSGVTIDKGNESTYSITFTLPADVEVKDYAGKFKASSSYGDVTKDFTLRVTPGAELQIDINGTLATYETKITELEKKLNETKGKGLNVSEAEAKFTELTGKFNLALQYRDSGDYRAAYDLLDDVDSLINQTYDALGISPPGKSLWDYAKWIIIGIAVAGIIVLVYLLWPAKAGYTQEKGYVPKAKTEEAKENMKEKLEKLKEKWKKIKEEKQS